MPYPDRFKPQRGPVSAGQLNQLVQAVRDLQLSLGNPMEFAEPEEPGRREILGKVINYATTGPSAGCFTWDEWEVRDGVQQVKTGGIQGRINGIDGWTDPTQFPAREYNGGNLATVPAGSMIQLDGLAAVAPASGAPGGLSYYFPAPQYAPDFTTPTGSTYATVANGAGMPAGGGCSVNGLSNKWQGVVDINLAAGGPSAAANVTLCRVTFSPGFQNAILSVIIQPDATGGFGVFADPSTLTANAFDLRTSAAGLAAGPSAVTYRFGYLILNN